MNQNKTILYNLINNKKVVVIAGAKYLEKYKKGNLIDSYDTVIRINNGHFLTQKDQQYGKRTDILYHCLYDRTTLTKENCNNLKVIVSVIPPLTLKEGKNTSFPFGYMHYYNRLTSFVKKKLTWISKKEYLDLENEVGCRPYTGIVTLYHILKLKPKKLYITGFTCFKNGETDIYKGKLKNTQSFIKIEKSATYPKSHNGYLIWLYLKKLISQNKNIIKLDLELQNILDLDIEKFKAQAGKNHNLQNYSNKEIFYYFLLNN